MVAEKRVCIVNVKLLYSFGFLNSGEPPSRMASLEFNDGISSSPPPLTASSTKVEACPLPPASISADDARLANAEISAAISIRSFPLWLCLLCRVSRSKLMKRRGARGLK